MDVGVSEFRSHLSKWLDLARSGREVVVTDRGVPIARLVRVDATSAIERLTSEGVIAKPATSRRPLADGRTRPRSRRPLAEIVTEQRR